MKLRSFVTPDVPTHLTTYMLHLMTFDKSAIFIMKSVKFHVTRHNDDVGTGCVMCDCHNKRMRMSRKNTGCPEATVQRKKGTSN